MKKMALGLFLLFAVGNSSADPFSSPSAQSLAQANEQMSGLSQAMVNGVSILESGDLASISAHSKYISSLVKVGEKKFGSSIFEPLGRCFAAGVDARTWWNSQLAAAQNGGVEKIPGSIKAALKEFESNRGDCLASADPVLAAKAEAESNAELKDKLGGGKECLTVFDVNPDTKEVFALPKPAHCKV